MTNYPVGKRTARGTIRAWRSLLVALWLLAVGGVGNQFEIGRYVKLMSWAFR